MSDRMTVDDIAHAAERAYWRFYGEDSTKVTSDV
jgi:hypothetical protein